MAKPSISVIISAKNEAQNIEACLESLREQKCRKSFEIMLVDNNSADNTFRLAQKIAKQDPRIHVFREKKPGSPCARNRGARESQGDIFLFTDADCTFTPNWIEKMAAPLLHWKEQRLPLAAVGGQTLSELPIGRKMHLAERYADALWFEWEQDRFSDFPGFLPWAPTCNLGVRREVFEALGAFDENWKAAGYDSDLCWRLVRNGFTIGYAPEAVLYHKRRQSVRKLLRQIESYGYHNRALLRHYEKLLHYNSILTRKERIESLLYRAKKSLQETRTLEDLRHRALDLLMQTHSAKGALRATYNGIKAEKKLDASRLGKSPATDFLPRPYKSLQEKGWCYWKTPADLASGGELILFHPQKKEWLRLNETAWRVWEVKANGGDSEAAARALGQEGENAEALSDIDALSWDLHQMGLLQ